MSIDVRDLVHVPGDDEGASGMIPVAGRGLVAGKVWIRPDAAGLVIRVDDDQNPEFWLELVLPEEQLLRYLARVHLLKHQGSGERRRK